MRVYHLLAEHRAMGGLERRRLKVARFKAVRQERRGFGLARARNAGAQAAAHDILVFLDGDVIPEAGLVAAHARWHHAVSDAGASPNGS